MVAGDFAGDGRLDLAVAGCCGGGLSVLLGNSNGTFPARGFCGSFAFERHEQATCIVAGSSAGDGRLISSSW